MEDELVIRELLATWHRAISDGNVPLILQLMSDDVVFLLTGHPPMRGKQAFETALRSMLQNHHLESNSEIQEIEISGKLAHCWSHLEVTITPLKGGESSLRAGNTLTILRKGPDDKWVVVRDANMLETEP